MLETTEARVREIIAAHQGVEGAMLPILHDVQKAFGHIPEAALPLIAESQMMTRAEAYGVMTFYHDFREAPAGRKVLKLCRAEACQAMGADELAERMQHRLGIKWHETTKDGAVTLEPIFCLGLCACGPAALVGETLVGRADEARLMEALK